MRLLILTVVCFFAIFTASAQNISSAENILVKAYEKAVKKIKIFL